MRKFPADAGQRLLMRSDHNEINGTAAFYQTELLAIAMGAKPQSIGVQFHMIKPDPNPRLNKKSNPETTL
jgi:heterodisulfide reductase subunit B